MNSIMSNKTQTIIELSTLKDKNTLTNSDYILVIMEICINSRKYHLNYSNTTKNFWDEVMTKEELGKLLRLFKSETLRKYWRIIRELHCIDKVIKIVKEHTELINNPSYKLLPIINHISSFIHSKEENFENFLKNIDKFKSNNPTPVKSKEKMKSIKTENNNSNNLLSKKRKPTTSIQPPKAEKKGNGENLEEDIMILDEKIREKESLKKIEDEGLELEEIINVFHEHFNNKQKEEIYNALYKTSANLKNAFLFLNNPEKYENLTFVGTDDYIIQNLKGKQYYEQLVASKGKSLVDEREKFLCAKIED